MDPHVPVGGLFKALRWAYEKVTNWAFLPTLLESHRIWMSRRALGNHWEPLGFGIEYSLDLPTKHFENDLKPFVRLAIRCAKEPFDYLIVVVEARKGNIVYDETRTVFNVGGDETKVLSLPGIPLQSVSIGDNGISVPFSTCRIRITELCRKGERSSVNLSSPMLSPTYTAYLNGTFIFRNGCMFNADAIEEQKRDLRIKIMYALGAFQHMAPTHRSPAMVKVLHQLRNMISKALCSEIVINILIWTPYVFRQRKLKAAEYSQL
jgi:hypothetical protein